MLMILRKIEQKSETIIELRKEKRMFPFWMAFSSFRNFLVKATIKKSKRMRTKIREEYIIRFFQTIVFFDPMLPNRISEGSGAGVITIFDFFPSSSSLRR